MKSLDKRLFISKVSKKINRRIRISHLNSIINLLCELLSKELMEKGEFSIHNFGTFKQKKNNPRRYFNVLKQETIISKGNTLVKFKLNRKLKKKIASNIDLGEDNGSTD